MRITRIIVNPIMNGNEPIDVDVEFELSFQDYTLRHKHHANYDKDVVYEVDLTQENFKNVYGKLYALDRQRDTKRYFTLYPWTTPKEEKETLIVSISVSGPCISWNLNIS